MPTSSSPPPPRSSASSPACRCSALFGFIILRGLSRVGRDQRPLRQLAAAGLIAQFGLQALINMAVNLNLIPTKGMTLPFISYGGSSLLALAIGLGMLLALTARRNCADRRGRMAR